jgi:hypothetical protein
MTHHNRVPAPGTITTTGSLRAWGCRCKSLWQRSAQAVGVGLIGAFGALAGGIGVSIKSAADFEQTMSGVRAVSGASAEQMQQLSSLALQLGKDTAFSASEAGRGIEWSGSAN